MADSYTSKKALGGLSFFVIVMAVGGAVAFLGASETLSCRAGPRGEPVCRAIRRAGPLVILDRDLGILAEVRVTTETQRTTRRLVQRERLDYLTAAGSSWGRSFRPEDRELQDRLRAFRDDPRAAGFDWTAPGNPRGARFGLAAFALGATITLLWLVGLVFPSLRPARRR